MRKIIFIHHGGSNCQGPRVKYIAGNIEREELYDVELDLKVL